MPLVTGVDMTLASAAFSAGDGGSDAKDPYFSSDLRLPDGKTEAVFTSDPVQAPMDFSDVAPHWWADKPDLTDVTVEVRTSKDGQTWADWEAADEEDIISASDSPTETYSSPIQVDPDVRTHRFVQSRVTLYTGTPGVTPVFHSLSYTFIDSGVTPNPPKPQVMIQGTPSDVAKPLMVARTDWGSPQGESSPKWTPTYKRVTHIVVHHTATSNKSKDWAAEVRSIWYYHSKTRGWGDIGYNYLIDPNGVIYEGRAGGDDVEAGHAYPFNVGTMGIGMIGNFMSQAPTAAAQQSLIDLISWKSSQRGIDPHAVEPITGYTDCNGKIVYVRPTIAGHRDYAGTACGRKFNTSTCPGDVLWSLLPKIRDEVVLQQPKLRANFGVHDTPGNFEPGATGEVHLSVRNSGSMTWQTAGADAVALGYRWLTPDGQPVTDWQDIRTPLSRSVSFADTITITAQLNAPKTPGHYALIWDMYADGIGWFSDQGSEPLRVDIVVGHNLDDKTPPVSRVLPLPVWSSNTDIPVRWAGDDNADGAGIVSYDVQSRVAPNGQWSDWKTGTQDTSATFTGEDSFTYEFRSRARDGAGNVEDWPAQADAYTTVDTRPPLLIIDDPESGDHVPPGQLQVDGKTEPGTYIVVNNQRASDTDGVFSATVDARGRDFPIHITAADPAGNVSRLELSVQAAPRYADVPMGHPAFQAIEYLSDKNIVDGYSDGLFRPDANANRAQYAKMLVTVMAWGLIKPDEPRFSDVPSDNSLYTFIETASAHGALVGFGDNTFQPGSAVSRKDAIRFALAATGNKDMSVHTLFTDLPPNFWANGCVLGEGKRNPANPEAISKCDNSPVTRADLSILMYNLYRNLQVLENPPPRDDQIR